MLKRALAALLCVLGAVAIGLGVASATVWRASDTLIASGQSPASATLLLTEPGVLETAADEVTVVATSEGERVVLAIGRTIDVDAWVGDDAHGRVSGLADWDVLAVQDVPRAVAEDGDAEPEGTEAGPEGTDEAEPGEGTEEEAPTDGEAAPEEEAATDEGEPVAEEATPAPDPTGSDLWVLEAASPDEARLEWTRTPGRWSLLAASTGADAGPVTVTLTWPQEVTTPWLVPGVAAGAVLLLVGLVWLIVLLVGSRRSAAAQSRRSRTATPAEPGVAPRRDGVTVTGSGGTPTDRPSGAVVPASSPGAPAQAGGDQPQAPITRRQLREMEQRRAAASRGRDRSTADDGPTHPGPARTDPRALAPAPTPRPGPPEDQAPSAAPSTDHAVGPTRRAAQPSAAPARTPGDPTGRWGRLSGRLPGRRPAAPGAPGVQDGAGTPPTPTEPDVLARPAFPPTASADAWRRAWGLPSGIADTPDGAPGADPPAERPGHDDQEGER